MAPSQVVRGVADRLGSLGQANIALTPDVASIVMTVARGAFVDAMRIGVLASIGIVGLSIVISLLTMPAKMRAVQAELDESGAADALVPTTAAGTLRSRD